jgi:hypothetical protein
VTINSHILWLFLGNVAVVIALGAFLDARAKKWTNENIVKPLTKNGGKNDPPTLPDRFHAQDEVMARIESKVDAQGQDLSRHLAWSSEETSRIWAAIKENKR